MHMSSRMPFSSSARQRGVTLTELMIALVLGALVVLAATAMVATSRSTYRTQDEGTRLAESARFGLELGNRLVRLAGYTNFGDDASPPAAYFDTTYAAWKISPDSYADTGPEIVGSNNSKPTVGAAINGSDSLTIRYFGTSQPNTTTTLNGGIPDGNILDCAGFAVPQPAQNGVAYSASRAYNVLFVDLDVDGEPALRCRRQTYDAAGNPNTGVNRFDTQTLIRGVEDFQVLYGELLPSPGLPLDDLDSLELPGRPRTLVYRSGIGGPNPVVEWSNVRSVKIAMLLRSATGTRPDPEPAATVYNLFGSIYPSGSDPGATFSLAALSTAERTRVRRVVETTVFVRNRVATWPSLQQ